MQIIATIGPKSTDKWIIKELIENGAGVDVFGVGDAIALPEKEISTY